MPPRKRESFARKGRASARLDPCSEENASATLADLNTRGAVLHADFGNQCSRAMIRASLREARFYRDARSSDRPLVEREKMQQGVMPLWINRDTLAGDRHGADAGDYPPQACGHVGIRA